MNHDFTPRPDDLDSILCASDDALLPSSGFTASVMHALRAEAAAPPPIAFPWKCALPGAAAALCGLVLLLLATIRFGRELLPPASEAPASADHLSFTFDSLANSAFHTVVMHANAGWIALAIALSLASLLLSWRLASTRP